MMRLTGIRKVGFDLEDCSHPGCTRGGYAYVCDQLLAAGEGTGYVVACRRHLDAELRSVIALMLGHEPRIGAEEIDAWKADLHKE